MNVRGNGSFGAPSTLLRVAQDDRKKESLFLFLSFRGSGATVGIPTLWQKGERIAPSGFALLAMTEG